VGSDPDRRGRDTRLQRRRLSGRLESTCGSAANNQFSCAIPQVHALIGRYYTLGRVWDAGELALEFQITAVIPPTHIVRRRSDGAVGTVVMQPRPPLYFNFRPSPPADLD